MSAASPWLALLLACADKGSPAGGPGGADSGEPVVDPFVDQALFEEAIAGARDPAQALAQIADQGGLPVLTDRGSYYFGCLCGAGDWELVGDHDGWAGAPLATAGELRWIEVEIPEPVESLYKYRRGEAYTADPLARRFGYDVQIWAGIAWQKGSSAAASTSYNLPPSERAHRGGVAAASRHDA